MKKSLGTLANDKKVIFLIMIECKAVLSKTTFTNYIVCGGVLELALIKSLGCI